MVGTRKTEKTAFSVRNRNSTRGLNIHLQACNLVLEYTRKPRVISSLADTTKYKLKENQNELQQEQSAQEQPQEQQSSARGSQTSSRTSLWTELHLGGLQHQAGKKSHLYKQGSGIAILLQPRVRLLQTAEKR